MFSIQECVSKTEEQRRKIRLFMDEHGYFDAKECNIYEGLKRSIQRELIETLRKLSLHELLFTNRGLSTGYQSVAGSQYLVPAWLSLNLYAACATQDNVPLISADVFEPRGSECVVPIGKLSAYLGDEGGVPTSGYTGIGATLKLVKVTAPMVVTNEMLEDNEFGLVEWATQQAGVAMAVQGNELALTVLEAAADGHGTRYYSATGDADETKYTGGATTDVLTCVDQVGMDGHIANSMVTTPESWGHSISETLQATSAQGAATGTPLAQGWHVKLNNLNLDVIFDTSNVLHDAADLPGAAFTACSTIIFDRNIALVTGRKNWLRIENYTNPVEDLAGAVITGRQDSVTVADDAIAVMTET